MNKQSIKIFSVIFSCTWFGVFQAQASDIHQLHFLVASNKPSQTATTPVGVDALSELAEHEFSDKVWDYSMLDIDGNTPSLSINEHQELRVSNGRISLTTPEHSQFGFAFWLKPESLSTSSEGLLSWVGGDNEWSVLLKDGQIVFSSKQTSNEVRQDLTFNQPIDLNQWVFVSINASIADYNRNAGETGGQQRIDYYVSVGVLGQALETQKSTAFFADTTDGEAALTMQLAYTEATTVTINDLRMVNRTLTLAEVQCQFEQEFLCILPYQSLASSQVGSPGNRIEQISVDDEVSPEVLYVDYSDGTEQDSLQIAGDQHLQGYSLLNVAENNDGTELILTYGYKEGDCSAVSEGRCEAICESKSGCPVEDPNVDATVEVPIADIVGELEDPTMENDDGEEITRQSYMEANQRGITSITAGDCGNNNSNTQTHLCLTLTDGTEWSFDLQGPAGDNAVCSVSPGSDGSHLAFEQDASGSVQLHEVDDVDYLRIRLINPNTGTENFLPISNVDGTALTNGIPFSELRGNTGLQEVLPDINCEGNTDGSDGDVLLTDDNFLIAEDGSLTFYTGSSSAAIDRASIQLVRHGQRGIGYDSFFKQQVVPGVTATSVSNATSITIEGQFQAAHCEWFADPSASCTPQATFTPNGDGQSITGQFWFAPSSGSQSCSGDFIVMCLNTAQTR